MPAAPICDRQRAPRCLLTRRCEGRTPCKIGITWGYPCARAVAADVSATAPLFCGPKFRRDSSPGDSERVLPPARRRISPRVSRRALKIKISHQWVWATALAALQAVAAERLRTPLSRVGGTSPDTEDRNGQAPVSIIYPQNSGALCRDIGRHSSSARITPNNADFTGSSVFTATG